MDLVLFGIQGSGKGTQAKRLAEEFDYYIFEAGGELRKIAASGTQLGETVKSYIDEGHLVPFEIIMEVVKAAIEAQPMSQKILFDGIPRDEDQMESFNEIMQDLDREFTCVQFLLSDEQAFARIASRAEKEGRADDADTQKVQRRIDTFYEKTMPCIEFYKSLEILKEVDADATMEEVYTSLKEALELV